MRLFVYSSHAIPLLHPLKLRGEGLYCKYEYTVELVLSIESERENDRGLDQSSLTVRVRVVLV